MSDMLHIPSSRRRLLILAGTGMFGLVAGCTTMDLMPSEPRDASDQTAAALPITNAVRAGRGLAPLGFDKAAQVAALSQARRMAKVGQMSHLIGFNDSFLKRMQAVDVTLPAAENIATGQDDVARAVDAWVKSPKHLKNMLGGYRGLGVAVAKSPSSANRPYWAMVLSS